MKVFIKIFLFLFLISLVSSCAKKNIEVLVPVIEYKIKDRALAKILDSLLSLKPKYFYTKIKIDYKEISDNIIRVIKGTNFDYFSTEAKNNFFDKEFSVTKLADRMGIRLSGPMLENIVNTNIKSEGLVRGTIQVPADGNPIIMLSDHGTIGGYPKIGVVVSADLDRVGQLTPGSILNFKEVSLEEAQNIFKAYTEDTDKYLNENN